MVIIRGMRHAQIDNGQHHEDERLQGNYQQVENQPAQIQHYLQRNPEQRAKTNRHGAADQSDQEENKLTRKQVTEQT